jgi:hypothetical protein
MRRVTNSELSKVHIVIVPVTGCQTHTITRAPWLRTENSNNIFLGSDSTAHYRALVASELAADQREWSLRARNVVLADHQPCRSAVIPTDIYSVSP